MLKEGIEQAAQVPFGVAAVNVGKGKWVACLPLSRLAELIAHAHGYIEETVPNDTSEEG